MEDPVEAFIDFEVNLARIRRPQYEAELRGQLIAGIPQMADREAELEPILTLEVGTYIDFMREAREAFKFGLWRAVTALIGIAAESFTDTLFEKIKTVRSQAGVSVSKKELFGDGEHISENRKMAVLFLFGVIEGQDRDKLVAIKKLRDKYVHPRAQEPTVEADAREMMRLFQSVIRDRFEREYAISNGQIVKREQPKK